MAANWARTPSPDILSQLLTRYVEWVALERDPDRVVLLVAQTSDGHELPDTPILSADEFVQSLGGAVPHGFERLLGPPPNDSLWLVLVERDTARVMIGCIDAPELDPTLFRALRGREIRDPLRPPERQRVREAYRESVARTGEPDVVIILVSTEKGLIANPDSCFVPRRRFIVEDFLTLSRLRDRIAAGPNPVFVWVFQTPAGEDRGWIWQLSLNDA
jgi:hypothetical protein